MYTATRSERSQNFGGNPENGPSFDVDAALNADGFMNFLTKFNDVKEKRFNISEASSDSEVKKRFEVFEAMPRVSGELKRMLQEKILKGAGIELKPEDLKDVDQYLEKKVFQENNFGIVFNLDGQLKELAELPGIIKSKESDLAMLGNRAELVGKKVKEEEKIKRADEKLKGLREEREAWSIVKEKQQDAENADKKLGKAKFHLENQGNIIILKTLSEEAARVESYLKVFVELKKDFNSIPPVADTYLGQIRSLQEALKTWKEAEGDPEELQTVLHADAKKGKYNAENMQGQLEATIEAVKHLAQDELRSLASDSEFLGQGKSKEYIRRLEEIAEGKPSNEEDGLKAEGQIIASELGIFEQLQKYMGILKKEPWNADVWEEADEAFTRIAHLRDNPSIGPILEDYSDQSFELHTWANKLPDDYSQLEKAAKAWRAPMVLKTWFRKGQKSFAETDFRTFEERIDNIDKANAEKARLRAKLTELNHEIFVQLEPAWQVLDKASLKIEEKINRDFFGEDKDLRVAFGAIDYLDSIMRYEDDGDEDNPIKLHLRERAGAKWQKPELKSKEGIAAKVAEKMLTDMQKAMELGGFETKSIFSTIVGRWENLKFQLGEFANTDTFKKMEKKVIRKLGEETEGAPIQIRLAAQRMFRKLNEVGS
jgi:hypothetical protein